MKSIKTSILTLLFFSASNFAALSTDIQDKNSSDHKKVSVSLKRSVKIEESGFDDNAITLDENAPVALISKDHSVFDKNSRIIEEAGTGYITCITSSTETCKYQLESKRFFVNEGDKIKVSYKVQVHPGDSVMFGLLNTKRGGWLGEVFPLSPGGICERVFKRVVPKDEKETSLVFYIHGVQGKPVHSSFTIENIKINKM